MNRPLSPAELTAADTFQPPHVMTRREKLLRFAMIVRQSPKRFFIFNNLERYNSAQLAELAHDDSAFATAAADPIFKDAGLSGQTPADAMKFFELSQHELHEFSCNCGGDISNNEMADRIERLAG